MNRYLFDTGTSREACAAVVVKNRYNALYNPSAAYGADLSLNDVLYGPPLSWPLGQRETSPDADGAVVMVLASENAARRLKSDPVWILGVGWTNGSASLESREWGRIPYLERAAQIAYRQAGIRNPRDVVDFAELDDTYAYKELQAMEALGLCSPGSAGDLTLQGYTAPNGELPVNVSGGSLGWGHLLDGTGLARAMEVVLQLRGQAGSRQLDDVEVGLVQSWRGVPTTSGAVAILSN
jgi:acetyl-CoA C-acetyltransferase